MLTPPCLGGFYKLLVTYFMVFNVSPKLPWLHELISTVHALKFLHTTPTVRSLMASAMNEVSILHLKGFSPVWMVIWWVSWPLTLNSLSHLSHLYWSPRLCLWSMCPCNDLEDINVLSHWRHFTSYIPSWAFKCNFRASLRLNCLGHCEHTNDDLQLYCHVNQSECFSICFFRPDFQY